MKKHILIALALIMIVFPILSGCSVIGKLSENGIKTSDGEIIVGDNVKWPEKNMAGLAKPNAELTAVLKDDTTGSYTVAFANMSKENAVQYVAKLKELGYQAILEFSDTDAVMFSGKNSSGVVVTFTYNITAQEGTISYVPDPTQGTVQANGTQSASQANSTNAGSTQTSSAQTSSPSTSGSPTSSTSVDMTDVSPWPLNFIAGVPELKGKIINVANQNNENITIDLEYVKKSDFEAYVSILKQNGYTVDVDETKDSYSYDFRAYNKAGDCASVTMSYEYERASVYLEKAAAE